MRVSSDMRSRLVTVCISVVLLCLGGCDSLMSPEARLERADQEAAAGNFTAAALDLRAALRKQPDNAQALLKLARLLLQLGDPQAARDELSKAFNAGARGPEYAAIAADIELAIGRPDQLLSSIDSDKLPVTGAQRSILRGRALNGMRRWPQGQLEFERALSVEPENADAIVGLATSLAAQGDLDGGMKQLAPLLARKDVTADALYLHGTLLARRGLYPEAEAAYNRAKADLGNTMSLPERARLLASIAESQLAQGNVNSAGETRKELAALAPDALLTRMLSARIDLAQGKYLDGIAELQRVVTSAPDFLQARMLLGTAHMAAGNLQQAAQQFQQIVLSSPENIEARKLLARVELQLDRPDEALRALTPALQNDSTDAQLYSLLGAANLRAGDSDRALEILERSVKANPGDESVRLELATAYLRAKRYQDVIATLKAGDPSQHSGRRAALQLTAITASQGAVIARAEVDKLLAERPGDNERRYVAIAYFVSQLEYERARVEISTLLKANPRDSRALVALATVEHAAGNLPAAEAALREGVNADGKDTRIRLMLARILLLKGDWANARTELDGAIAAGGGNANIVNAAGLLLLDSQRYDEALARFRRAAELTPTEPNYWLNAARSQAALNEPAAARESANKAIALRPDWLPATSLLVLLDLRTKGPDAALARASELRTRNPGDAGVLALLGDVYVARREFVEAVKVFEEAERKAPDAALAVRLYEAVRSANLDRPEASLVRWLAGRPDDTRVRLVLAQFYMQTDRPDRAINELESITRQNPNLPAVLNNLAWLYHERRDPRAERTAQRAYQLAPNAPAIGDTYGWILLSRQKVGDALSILETAARSAASEPEIQYHYAAALAQAGRHSEARTVLVRVVGSIKNTEQRRDAEKLLASLKG
jgi:cellulose synthase operon protein C